MGEANKVVFLKASDELANNINTRAGELFDLLHHFDVTGIDIGAEYKYYFINHHLGPRLFFSLQNSAHIIYEAVKKTGKPVNTIQFIDYGAGLGTLFMLAGTMGFKKTVYNDYLPEWQQTAQSICEALNIPIDAYVTGDIDPVMQHAAANNIRYDIIASRNVIEHIYDLPHFYDCVFNHNPAAVTYSTTTANFHNPAMRLYHLYIHKRAEKDLQKQRASTIRKIHPQLTSSQVDTLTVLTRGKGQQDFIDAVNNFARNQPITAVPYLRSNTCDCMTGVWIEHLLTRKEHRHIMVNAGFKSEYYAGYWDTHYTSGAMNVLGRFLNNIISLLGKQKGVMLSPFVNIVAHQ